MASVFEILRNKGDTVWTIQETDTVYKGLQIMAEKDVGALVVLNSHGNVVGLFSERDYARKVILMGKSSLTTYIKDLMVSQIHVVTSQDSIELCMKLMTESHIRHLPVMEDGKLKGLVSIGDVVNHLIKDQKFQIKELTRYITG